ncbi:uncharacterized protein K452DRAFT_63494 [Aplosporella prunicola CBS 121167]|uniref:Protein-lysine N-methyltransferase EFM4 n=1 Tax=Aplosporella prunicola CBS 121167 TaxID=1176127 RepID=A0A6A6B9P6_9PEZI|nr:uncharacterized protein K452DRAFT_63494 [Aplosporella prunicola CBS 121167]KAF2139637.1 hypothetical protein K452DRAFT_63494 [Aplosporella prunicola CBS 121167]
MSATDDSHATKPTHLDPSALGTREYWDDAYTVELANHAQSAEDEGTIWFSDAGAEERMLQYLEDLADEGRLHKEEEEGETTSFLDLGTGNGHLLFALRDDDWEGRMVGVDYSRKSVELARRIGETRRAENEELRAVQFEEFDILAGTPGEWLGAGFDVVLDKGTFDAISLSGEMDAQGRRICEGYREQAEKLIKKGGILLITSCNWTAEELKEWFVVDGGELEYEDAIKYPSFTFGGKTGQQVCSLVFRRKTAP